MIKFSSRCNNSIELLSFERIVIMKVTAEVDHIAVSYSYLISK